VEWNREQFPVIAPPHFLKDGGRDSDTHVVGLGAGFAGLQCTRSFRDWNVVVKLLDRQSHQLFQPLLR
jgi:hypothetical protein